MKLRKRIPICYFERKESCFDDYIYCEKCTDFVYEYCSLHGPLLIIPDSPVHNTSKATVPHSALTLPQTFLHLAPSTIPGAGIGVFSSLTLPRGVRLGPYRGKVTRKATSTFNWQIHSDDGKPSHVVDASNPATSNWLRYVNCARRWREQNLVAYQYKGQIYYRTIKIIPPFTELMVFYGSESAAALNVDLRIYNSEELTPDKTENQKEEIPTEFNKLFEINPNQLTHTIVVNNDDFIQDIAEQNVVTLNEEDFNAGAIEIAKLDIQHNTNDFFVKFDKEDRNLSVISNTYEAIDSNTYEGTESVENGPLKNDIATKYDSENYFSNNPYANRKTSCHICFKAFDKPYGLKRHYKTHKLNPEEFKITSPSLYVCDICAYPCETINNLMRHKLRKHSLNKCHICSKIFYETTSFSRHLYQHKNVKKHNCTKCSFKTNFMHILNQHLRVHMAENVYKCDNCKYVTYRRDCIARHVKIHFKIVNMD